MSRQRPHTLKTSDARALARSTATTLKLLFRWSPRDTLLVGLMNLILAIMPGTMLFLERRFVNAVAEHSDRSSTSIWTISLLAMLATYAVLSTAGEAIEDARMVVADRLRHWTLVQGQEEMMRKNVSFASLDLHETPDTLNAQRLAQQGLGGLVELVWELFAVSQHALSLIPIALLLGSIEWWIPFIVAVSIAPGVQMMMAIPGKEWAVREEVANQERDRDLLLNTILRESHAKDIRLFEAGQYLIGNWRRNSDMMVSRITAEWFRLFKRAAIWTLIFGTLVIVPIIWTFRQAENGEVSVGSFAMLLSSLTAVRRGLWVVFGGGSNLLSTILGVEKYVDFLGTHIPVANRNTVVSPMPRLAHSLSMHNLSFAYPAAERPTLSDFSFTLNKGESVALVGANGAGKTTISRLLGRLFDPQAGEVRWDNMPVTDHDPAALRHRLAFVPQDFAQFPLTLRENVSIGRLNDPPTDEEVIDVLERVGLADLLARSDHPLDMTLTKELEGGTQLSGGQWQRLAIARALIRAEQADVLILDEPTAALDPTTEVEITRLMLSATHGKTALIISHRLGICTLVDRVVVLDKGKVIEDGTHLDLLAAGGVYADMFRSQAEWYA